MTEEEYRDKIYQFLIDNDNGVTATEIANSIGSNRMTVTKYLNVMMGQDLVTFRGVGMAKLWKIQHSPLLNSFENGNNHLLKEAMNLLGEGVCVIDREMKVVWYNGIVEKFVGSIDKNKGKSVYQLFDREKDDERTKCVISTFNTGDVHKAVHEIPIKGKKYYFEIVTSPIKDKENKIIAVIMLIVDFNDYKRKMSELKSLMGK